MNNHYDIVIVGAGIVGLTLANRLAQSGLSLLVIDSKAINEKLELPEYPMRVSAISKRSQKIFSQIRVWNTIENLRVSPYREMKVWDSQGQGQIIFDSADIGMPELGHIIENDVMVYALQQRLHYFDSVHIAAPLQLEEIQITDTHVNIQAGNKNITAKLLIGADGANSWVRQQLAVPLTKRSYDHKAIVATVKTSKSHQLTAWQCFLPTGPLAFLPLADQQTCSIVWSCIPERGDELLALDDEAFAKELTKAFEHRLGDITHVGPRAAFPLYMRHADYYTQSRVALVGDAAHTIHPLAGQGVNLGIADADKLVEVLLTANDKKHDIGKHAILRRYERARKAENTLMIRAMAGFKNLFGSELSIVKLLRNSGLNLVNQMTPLKNWLIQSAMGIK